MGITKFLMYHGNFVRSGIESSIFCYFSSLFLFSKLSFLFFLRFTKDPMSINL